MVEPALADTSVYAHQFVKTGRRIFFVSEKFNDYAEKVAAQLEEAGIRTEKDLRSEKIGFKIREARNERVPYIIVVGERDVEASKVSLRSRAGEEGQQDLADVIARITEEIKTRA